MPSDAIHLMTNDPVKTTFRVVDANYYFNARVQNLPFNIFNMALFIQNEEDDQLYVTIEYSFDGISYITANDGTSMLQLVRRGQTSPTQNKTDASVVVGKYGRSVVLLSLSCNIADDLNGHSGIPNKFRIRLGRKTDQLPMKNGGALCTLVQFPVEVFEPAETDMVFMN